MKTSIKKEIAIVGISCRFPQSADLHSFWENLKNGNEMIRFYETDELSKLGVPAELIQSKNFIPAAADVENSGSFDFSFFGYTPEESAVMDPQIRVLHESAWNALEDAAINTDTYKGRIGSFFAAGDNPLWRAKVMLSPNDNVNPYTQKQLSNKNFISSLIAYNLNLKGPSYYLDTACSSSLASVHLACRSLLLKECSIALAGGVNISSSAATGYQFEQGMIFSDDGHCRPFDAQSSGTIAAEGVGVVVLKRLEEAINDRDHIYAVVKSSAINNDGHRKIGYTAPSVIGQYECISMAQKIAGVSPSQIEYIEAHGTATKIGDPIEIKALNKAFNNDTTHNCNIGSVKSNMGHSDAAAGIAGLIKTSLVLQNKSIPPSLHFKAANPEVEFDKGPFRVNTELKSWNKAEGQTRIAGVSSFGVGGTNVHAILEEAPVRESSGDSKRFQLITFSSRSTSAFERNASLIRDSIENHDKNLLPDIAYTLNTGRKGFEFRDFEIIDSTAEAFSRKTLNPVSITRENVVFMFPGQGSQYFSMGKALYEEEPFFRETMDEGFEILTKLTATDYRRIIGYVSGEDENLINETLHTQPVLFLLEFSLARLYQSWGVQPSMMIGHSLGEYVAACIAGVFSFEDGLKLVVERARLMSSVSRGSMLAVGIAANELEIPGELSVAAVNTPDSCVVSGPESAINGLLRSLEQKNIPSRILKTSHAFHSGMMDGILDEFRSVVKDISLNAPEIPFISNLTGKAINGNEAVSCDYWVKHLRSTVLFSSGIQQLGDVPNTLFLELGPGRTLSGLIRQIHPSADNTSILSTLKTAQENTDDRFNVLNTLGILWKHKVLVEWPDYYKYEKRNKLPLPHYSFDIFQFPSKIDLGKINHVMTGPAKDISDCFYLPVWKRSFDKPLLTKDKAEGFLLIFKDPGTEVLVDALSDSHKTISVRKGDRLSLEGMEWIMDPSRKEDYARLFEKVAQEGFVIEQVIYGWNHESLVPETLEQIVNELVCFSTAIAGIENLHVSFVSGVPGMDSRDNSDVAAALMNVHAQENPSHTVRFISFDENSLQSHTTALIGELTQQHTDFRVYYERGKRWIKSFEQEKLEISQGQSGRIKKHGRYIITGGTGKVGQIVKDYLIREYSAEVFLLGRKAASYQESDKVHYRQVDVSNREQLQQVFSEIESAYGEVNGVFHLTGNTDPKSFKTIDRVNGETIQAQLDPKVKGTVNLYEVLKNRPVDFVWISSSLSSIVGGLTFGVYAAANAFLNAFVKNKRDELANWFCVDLDGVSESAKDSLGRENLEKVIESSFLIEEFPELIVSIRHLPSLLSEQRSQIDNHRVETAQIVSSKRPETMVPYEPPASEIEQKLSDIWTSFFKMDKIGVNDNFFDLGGDSLKGMTVSKRIQKTFNVELDLNEFYNKPTIAELAKEIELALKLAKMQETKAEGYKHIKI